MRGTTIKLVYLLRQTVGGMQKHVLELASGLDRSRYQLQVIAPENSQLQAELKKLSIPFHRLDIADNLNLFSDWQAVRALKEVLSGLKPDILHIHGNKSAMVGRLAARGLNIPVVIVTVHNFLKYQDARAVLRLPASWLERWLTTYTDRIITVSTSLERSLIEVEHLPSTKINTIFNGIDVSQWDNIAKTDRFRRSRAIKDDDFLVANIGRLVPFKGHKILLEAASILTDKSPEIKFAIAGNGPLKQELLAKRDSLGLEKNVFFLGHVADVKELLAAADIFVLPSLKEPFGIVLLEAMAARLPTVATGAGGVPEIIKGESGILVPPNDPEALATAINKLFTDPEYRRELVDNAYQRVSEEFSIKKMVALTDELYRNCLRRKPVA